MQPPPPRLLVGTKHASAREQPGHKILKYRRGHQVAGSADAAARAEALRAREARHDAQRRAFDFDAHRERDARLLGLEAPAAVAAGPAAGAGAGAWAGVGSSRLVPSAADADLAAPSDASDGTGASGSDDDDGSDDEAALLAELERIRSERAAARRRDEAAAAVRDEVRRRDEAAAANPLLGDVRGDGGGGGGGGASASASGGASLKRRWHEETPFSHQAQDAPRAGQRFVNDTVRSDFHRRFLDRYCR